MNFLETAIPVAIMVLITSLYQPLWALICMSALALGRVLYAVGYQIKGPKGRVCGAIIVDLALLGAFVGAIVSIANWDTTSNVPRLFPISQDQYN